MSTARKRSRTTAGGYAPGRARQERILAAADALFGEVGYRSASLREIASRSGISHPTLLYHFPNKRALLFAVIEARREAEKSAFGLDGDDAAELFTNILLHAQYNSTRRGLIELFVLQSAEATGAEHPARQYFKEHYRRARSYYARAYRLAAEQGLLRDGVNLATAADRLIALQDGLQIQWMYDPSIDVPNAMRDALSEHLLLDFSEIFELAPPVPEEPASA